MRPGFPYYFEFLIQNQTENDWVADGKVICLQPYINEQGRKCDLVLEKEQQCTLGFEITIPMTNTQKKIKVQMCFHSEQNKKAFGEPIYIKIDVDHTKKPVNQ